MSGFGGFAKPGQGAAAFTTERNIFAQGFEQNHAFYDSAVISGATRDAGNTPTTVLRPGLLLGVVDASGEYEEWDADATDGTQDLRGVLRNELRAQDFDATNTDRVFGILVGGARLQTSQLLIQGTLITSHIDEFLARRALYAAGFRLDDDPFGYLTGLVQRIKAESGTSDTLTESQNGSKLFYSSASAVNVILPAIHPGLVFDIVRTGDEEIVVNSAEGNNLLVGNNKTTADKITFTTASEHIGAFVRVEGIYDGTTPLWHVTLPQIPFGTNGTGLTYAIGTS